MVTRGDREDHEKKLFDVLKKLEDAGYRASERKSEFFKNKLKWLGHEIDENGIKPNKEKIKAILELKHPENPKQLKFFFQGNTIFGKILTKIVRKNRQITKITVEKHRMEMGNGTTK